MESMATMAEGKNRNTTIRKFVRMKSTDLQSSFSILCISMAYLYFYIFQGEMIAERRSFQSISGLTSAVCIVGAYVLNFNRKLISVALYNGARKNLKSINVNINRPHGYRRFRRYLLKRKSNGETEWNWNITICWYDIYFCINVENENHPFVLRKWRKWKLLTISR